MFWKPKLYFLIETLIMLPILGAFSAVIVIQKSNEKEPLYDSTTSLLTLYILLKLFVSPVEWKIKSVSFTVSNLVFYCILAYYYDVMSV